MQNKIQIENDLIGTSQWQLDKPVPFSERDPDNWSTPALEGYASLTSVNIGGDISFYVRTKAPTFSVEIYRMGYYNNLGGRLMKKVQGLPSVMQPMPTAQDSTNYGLIECNWIESYRLTVPTDWVSGVYLAKLLANDASGWQSYIIFVVRDDARASDVLMQCSVNTYQAYNGWGGRSIYEANSKPEDISFCKVSFNRPYFAAHRGHVWEGGQVTPYARGAGHLFAHFPFGTYEPAWEYNMIRWLEQKGYDVTYCTNIDTHRDPKLLLSRRAFLSVGHDEYWTREMRVNAELARDQGVDLMFFSGNSVYRQSRLENDAQGNPHRTLVCFKPDKAAAIDPVATRIVNGVATDDDLYPYPNVTGEFWKELRYSVQVAWPEASLTGSTWTETSTYWEDLTVTAPSDWIFGGSGAALNQALVGLGGYELDGDFHNSAMYAPGNRRILATSGSGGRVQAYAVDGGATVFSSGSMHWSWGLDDWKIQGCTLYQDRPAISNPVVQQITTNLLARAVRTTGAESHYLRPDGSGGLADLGQASNLRVRWRIIPGSFSAPQSTDALFYDPTTGEAQLYTLRSSGSLVPISTLFRGWRKSLCIIAGKFSDSGLTDLLFYDRASGEAQFHRADGKGHIIPMSADNLPGISPIGPMLTGWRRTLQIIPGRFGGSGSTTDLLFYNPARGEVQFCATDGRGGIQPIGGLSPGWRRTWQIIPGQFGGTSGRTDLYLYDPTLGESYFFATNGQGGIQPIGAAHTGLRRSWRIIPGRFRDASTWTDLLHYDPASGEAQFYTTDGAGGLTPLGSLQTGWRRTWQIFPVVPSASAKTDLLFFDSFATVP